MSFWNDKRPMTGMTIPNAEKIACRTCRFAEKEHICLARCVKYPDEPGKPDDVCFDNAPCPEYEEGEDLLPYEIEI